MEDNQKGMKHEMDQKKVAQAEDMMINTIADTMDLYGVTPSVGRLYGTMYFKHHPITLDEMKEDLGMSKPSMSTSVRKLQDINIVKKVWEKGSRKDSFMAEKNFFNYFAHFFGKKWEREVSMFLESIIYAQKQLNDVIEDSQSDETLKEQARLDYQQLDEAKVYYHWLDRLTKLIKSEEIYKYLPIEESEDKE